ncbi:MAG: D-alanyl-D-alanine carboxypeptidase [Solirubrobacterales bacterium]|nr:D-alanyl-D-alanine carboxypeptidase [Solirubrobacterales bacterium]
MSVRRRRHGPTFRRRRRTTTRRAAAIAAQVALVAAAVFLALWAVLGGRDGDSPAPSAAASAVASEPAPPGSFESRSPAPIRMIPEDAFAVRWRKPPRAALVFDMRTGESLYRRAARREYPIASLTKIMTALAVTAATEPDEAVTVPRGLRYEGSAVGLLPKGRRVRAEPLLGGLMIVSGNDAAIVLARHVSGTVARFVALMNEQARLWELGCTRFETPHGLSDGDRSCAVDLAVMTRLAMRRPRIAAVAGAAQASYRFPIEGGKLYLSGHNPLIRAGYRGATGLKTGYTDAAGRCFVGVARRGGRSYGVVLLDSPDPGRQAARLLDLAFATG